MTREGINPKLITNDGKNLNVMVSDQTSPPLDLYFTIPDVPNFTTLANLQAIDDKEIELASVTGFVDDTYVGIFSPTDGRFYFGNQLGAPVSSVITLDTPLDFAFPVGSNVVPTSRDLNVNGSVTPVIASVTASGPVANKSVDITRIIVSMVLATQPDDGLFGNIAALTNGIVLRRNDGEVRNIWNVKANADLAALAYDVTYTARSVPQGSYGMRCRYTFAGQDKHGVAVRLDPGDFLQLIIQDDLEALTEFRIIAAGHIVQD